MNIFRGRAWALVFAQKFNSKHKRGRHFLAEWLFLVGQLRYLRGLCVKLIHIRRVIVKIHNILVGVGLCAAVSGAGALTLGAARGTVVLGAPVSLAFEVRPDPGQSLDASCVAVKLLAGGSEFATGKVQVIPVASGSSPVLRVRAAVPVMEPVLTVNITAGCQGSVTRSYTFLSELPAEAPRSAQPVDIQQLAGNVGVRQAVGRIAEVDAANAAPRRAPMRKKADQPQVDRATQVRRALRPLPTAAPAVSRSPETLRSAPLLGAAATEAAAGSRLVMEAFDLSLDANTALRLSRDLPSFADPVEPQKREQAAALWRALNLSSDVQQLQTWVTEQEADVQKQKAAAASDRAAANELRERLQQVEAERFSPLVVYALGALVALALAVIAWLLRRKSREAAAPADAWKQSLQQVDQSEAAAPEARKPVLPGKKKTAKNTPAQEPQWAQTMALKGQADAGTDAVVPPATAEGDESASQLQNPTQPLSIPATMPVPVAGLEVQEVAAPTQQEPVAGVEKLHQIVHPEQLFDTLQQAEFFISVGEHEQAIGVLRKHIEEHGEASPIAYLELLRLYHTLGRSDNFEQLRQEFHARFNASLPVFAQFHNLGAGLEQHPEVLARIEALWTSPEVLGVLDECLFQRGEHQALGGMVGGTVGPFEPAALEDLLLLLAIVQTTPASQRGAPGPRSRTTPLAPAVLAAAGSEEKSFDSLAEELALMPSDLMPLPTMQEEAAPEKVAQDLGLSLDLNLEDLPSLAPDVHAPAPVAAPAAPATPAVDFNIGSGPLDFDFEALEKPLPGKDGKA